MTSRPIEDRFWDKVEFIPFHECWEWMGALDPAPLLSYGRFRFNGKTGKAHRFSWELHNGPISEGMCVCHKCDNPSCVNPDHLFLGTNADNAKDRDQKGRHVPPIKKLNSSVVREIRRLLGEGMIVRKIAERFGVSMGAIDGVKYGYTWKHVQ